VSTEPLDYDDLAVNPLNAVWPPGKVIIVNESGPDHVASWLIVPALGRLKRPERWMTWISPPYKPTSEFLRASGINPKHLRIIHRRTRRDRLLAAEQALASRTNDIVLIWMTDITAHDRDRLNDAAAQASTRGMLIGMSAGADARRKRPQHSDTTDADADRADQAPQLGLQLD